MRSKAIISVLSSLVFAIIGFGQSDANSESKKATVEVDAELHAKHQEMMSQREIDAELSKKLANPIAAMISAPFQFNFDFSIGPNDGWRQTLNIQPIIPIRLDEDWNIISRTVLPVIYQEDVIGHGSEFGLGDTTQSFFLSPSKAPGGWVWGVGPAFLLPTATRHVLGTEKWGAGPSAILLKQHGPFTVGFLANHVWSFAGSSSRDYVSNTFLQPFAAVVTPSLWTITFTSETEYDWNNEEWTVPLNLVFSRIETFGKQKVNFGFGGRVYADRPDGGPDWGLRFVVTFLFPEHF